MSAFDGEESNGISSDGQVELDESSLERVAGGYLKVPQADGYLKVPQTEVKTPEVLRQPQPSTFNKQ